MLKRISLYYSLTKPGVLYGNVITAVAGFLLASRGDVDIQLFLAVVIGTTLIIGSACAINNVLDADIDSKMDRTKKRVTVSGEISPTSATLFSAIIGIIGLIILTLFTNELVVVSGLIGYIVYVIFYGATFKRLSIHGTLVGSISGAIPIFAGYVGASGEIDLGAIFAFLAIFFWQMPEFYSIAIYRLKEYRKADVPVMTVIKGIPNTVMQIFIYTILVCICTLALTPLGYTGYTFLVVMGLLSLYWIYLAINGVTQRNNKAKADKWARKMFHFSLIFLVVYSVAISVDSLLP